MDKLTFIAGLLATFMVMGHFFMGLKWYLKPMLDSDFDEIAKATMQSVFHYVSIFLILSAVALVVTGLNIFPIEESDMLVKFIGISYILFAIVQIFYSFRNRIEKPLINMFQWTLFLPVGILCLL